MRFVMQIHVPLVFPVEELFPFSLEEEEDVPVMCPPVLHQKER